MGPDRVFGGTCLNVGCIPTKMLVRPADLARVPEEAARLGVDLTLDGVRWREIRDRIFGRIDSIAAAGEEWRRSGMENLTLIRGRARFTGPRTLQVGDRTVTADRFVLTAGSRTMIPDVPGLVEARPHTSDTIMRIDDLPGSIIITGGGYIAAEFAHVLSSLGVQVTVINRSGRLLRKLDRDISDRFTEIVGRRWQLALGRNLARVERLDDGRVRVHTTGDHGDETFEADDILVAMGRVPNGDSLDPAAAGIDLDEDGYVVVDEYQRTTAEGIHAAGDVCSPWQLKHVANHEARVVQHNLLHPDDPITADHRFVPAAIFTDPQIATVGRTEEQARDAGVDLAVARQDYGSVAYGWAMEDSDHFVKLLADRSTGQLVGAHLIGPEASILVQPLVQAMSFSLPVREMARGQYWIHPALTEVVENALLALEVDA